MRAAIPVTVLTGFLGSGKTTLLNRLLARPELARTAVLINEFGEIGLDHLMVEKVDGDVVLLSSGCLCCTVRGELVDSLRSLAARADAGEIDFDRVVIETTGLADPAPILHTLMAEPDIVRRYRLDGIVTTVDAATGSATLDAQPESVKQAAVADRLVLTKTDLAGSEALADLSRRLAMLNPGARRITAVMGEVAPEDLLNAGLFDPAKKIPDVAAWLNAEAYGDHHHHHHHRHHDHGDHHHHHDHAGQDHVGQDHVGQDPHDVNRHDARIRSFCLTFEEPLHWAAIATWLEMLIVTRGESLLRIKGILDIAGQEKPVAIHGVQHLLHPPAPLPAWPKREDGSDDRRSRIVFIVRDLDRAVVEQGLAAFNKAAAQEAALRA
jgi:G3E family GTPase